MYEQQPVARCHFLIDVLHFSSAPTTTPSSSIGFWISITAEQASKCYFITFLRHWVSHITSLAPSCFFQTSPFSDRRDINGTGPDFTVALCLTSVCNLISDGNMARAGWKLDVFRPRGFWDTCGRVVCLKGRGKKDGHAYVCHCIPLRHMEDSDSVCCVSTFRYVWAWVEELFVLPKTSCLPRTTSSPGANFDVLVSDLVLFSTTS